MDYLLHLPSPPQILFLPPYESLPDPLLTLLLTMRTGLTNPQAQLHSDPLPRTPAGVREFVKKWATAPSGTTGEGGRRIDAIVLGSGWELTAETEGASGSWTIEQFHFHLITSLLPHLLRAPAERSIRIISLVAPTWSSSLPLLNSTPADSIRQAKSTMWNSIVQVVGLRGVITMLVMKHFSLILDTLASAAYSNAKPVPSADGGSEIKMRDTTIQSNILGISVIMPWARSEVVRPLLGVDRSWVRWILSVLSWLRWSGLIKQIRPDIPVVVVHHALATPERPVNTLRTSSAGPLRCDAHSQWQIHGRRRCGTKSKRCRSRRRDPQYRCR